MRRGLLVLGMVVALTTVLITQSAAAHAEALQQTVIDFSEDPTGSKPDGWTSADSDVAHFWDSIGADLDVSDYAHQSFGNALGVFGDDPSGLRIRFDVEICEISLSFGNDDPGFSNPGDEAVLRGYVDGVVVAETRVELNRNDDMDQTISLSGVTFNGAGFLYDVTTSGLIEIVDDITFTPC
jgi:hypothetical protein